VKTKRGADQLADKLRRQDLSADSIHGDLKQRQRDRAILQFRNSKTRIMVATDIAARGLDIPHIRHVINYDLPQCPEDYIHRIGRTARAGSEGNALCLLCPDDNAKWNAINRLMNPGAAKEPANQGGGGRSGQGRPYKGRSNGRPNSGGAHQGRPDFPRKKTSSGDTFGQSWGKPRREASGESQGKPWDRPRREASGESQGKPWDRPRREASGEAQGRPQGGKPWDRPRREGSGESQGKPWDRPRRETSGESQGQSQGRPQEKPQGKTWDKPRRDSTSQPFPQGARPSAQPWGGAKGKPSGFNPNGPKKSPPKRFSRGS